MPKNETISEKFSKRYRLRPGKKVNLGHRDPDDTALLDADKKTAREELKDLCEQLNGLQEVLYAQNKHKVLIVLQGMDTAGKDGVIRHVFGPLNPQGVRVANFKAPSEKELAHDYLWRIHRMAPRNGEIVIFNRSHYEDVTAVPVYHLVPKKIWKRRFRHLCAFEQMLADEGTVILKFFLHIDKDEQKKRLQARLAQPEKRWKFQKKDLQTRNLWPQFMKAYETALNQTNIEYAPWHIVPSNKKWYRDIVVANVVLHALKKLNMRYPKPENLKGVRIQ